MKPPRRGDRWLWAAGALAAAVLLGNKGFRNLVSRGLELRSVRREIAVAERDEAALKSRLKALTNGDASLERAARKDLGYLKPGEVEYRFPKPQ